MSFPSSARWSSVRKCHHNTRFPHLCHPPFTGRAAEASFRGALCFSLKDRQRRTAPLAVGNTGKAGQDRLVPHTTHPYTKGLFNSIPSLDKDTERLQPIQGLMPDPANLPEGCKFHPRCPYAVEACAQQHPGMTELTAGHLCRCLRCGDPILSQEGVHHE